RESATAVQIGNGGECVPFSRRGPAEHEIEDAGGGCAANHLYENVGRRPLNWESARGYQTPDERWIKVGAGDVTNSEPHGHRSQADREGDSQQSRLWGGKQRSAAYRADE